MDLRKTVNPFGYIGELEKDAVEYFKKTFVNVIKK